MQTPLLFVALTRQQCDTTRPECGRCRKASRACQWDYDAGGLPFRDENAFAGGQPRRPRDSSGKRSGSPSTSSSVFVMSPPSRALVIPLETHALQYWITNYASWSDDLIDIGHGYCNYAIGLWNYIRPDSCVRNAIAAFAHATFARARRDTQALVAANTFYAQAITRLRQDISELCVDRIDESIVATMLLSAYDVGTFPL
jgi:hypothetical protein